MALVLCESACAPLPAAAPVPDEPRPASGPRPVGIADAAAPAAAPMPWRRPEPAIAGGRPGDAAAPAPVTPRFGVVELPQTLGLGLPPQRPHHALKMPLRSLSRSLEAAGLEHADCQLMLRLPSRLRQGGGGGATLDVRAQLVIGCRH